MSACAPGWPRMTEDPATVAFLCEAIGPGATVVVIGSPGTALCAVLAQAAGPTGLVAVCAPDVKARCPGAARLRATPASGIPVLSHAADVVLLLAGTADDAGVVAEEVRRLLAPRGAVRALLPAAEVEAVATALRHAAFRDVQTVPLGDMAGIRALGPR